MLGAIIGDIVGSPYELHNLRSKDFDFFTRHCRFTDDSVLTIATAQALMTGRDYAKHYRAFALEYPHRGYGGMFREWVGDAKAGPYKSLGNGSAMRISPVAYASDRLDEVLAEAKRSAEVTHNHEEGIRGAQAVASAIFLARKGGKTEDIRMLIEGSYHYDLRRKLDELRKTNRFDETCPETIPVAVVAVLEAYSFEDAIRNAVSVGGDSDTIACIAGSIAEPLFGIPKAIRDEAILYLDPALGEVVEKFNLWGIQGRRTGEPDMI